MFYGINPIPIAYIVMPHWREREGARERGDTYIREAAGWRQNLRMHLYPQHRREVPSNDRIAFTVRDRKSTAVVV